MFDFLFPTEPFGGQTLRLVAQAQQGGGDLFDIARTCRDIKPGDKQSWEKGWHELAQNTEARAREALAAGRKITARDYFFHANQYYRMSDVFPIKRMNLKQNASAKLKNVFVPAPSCTHRSSKSFPSNAAEKSMKATFAIPTVPRPVSGRRFYS
jgi:hypothetical protein